MIPCLSAKASDVLMFSVCVVLQGAISSCCITSPGLPFCWKSLAGLLGKKKKKINDLCHNCCFSEGADELHFQLFIHLASPHFGMVYFMNYIYFC